MVCGLSAGHGGGRGNAVRCGYSRCSRKGNGKGQRCCGGEHTSHPDHLQEGCRCLIVRFPHPGCISGRAVEAAPCMPLDLGIPVPEHRGGYGALYRGPNRRRIDVRNRYLIPRLTMAALLVGEGRLTNAEISP